MKTALFLLLLLLPCGSFADCPAKVPSDRACVSWTPPTKNTDGTTLTNLAGFKIYLSQSSTFTNGVSIVTLSNPGLNHQMLTGLARGIWYFRMTAFSSTGAESAFTGMVSKTIRFGGPTDGAIERPTDGSIEPRN